MNERAPSLAPWLLWLGVSACVDPREGTVLRDAYLDDTSWIDPSRPQDTGGAADGQHGDSRDGRDGADPADTVSVSDGRTPLEEGACVRLHHVSEPVDFEVVDVGGSRDTVVSVSNCGSVEIGPLWLRIGGEHPQAYRIVVPPPAGSSVVGVAGDYE
ncbi:MAG TPA: hypothetical protein PK095_18275, partial [Myxococcota bacterium]|nr:hypothetical protein [Myxococcota bacterium]